MIDFPENLWRDPINDNFQEKITNSHNKECVIVTLLNKKE